jgi:hypothetical protein
MPNSVVFHLSLVDHVHEFDTVEQHATACGCTLFLP